MFPQGTLADQGLVGGAVTLFSGQGQSATFAISNDPAVTTRDFNATFTYLAPGTFFSFIFRNRPSFQGR